MNRAVVAGVASSVAIGVPIAFVEFAAADASSGWAFIWATGPYFPSWYADDCQLAYLQSGTPPTEFSDSLSDVDPNQCNPPGANMLAGWMGTAVQAYHNGKNCGTTSYTYNPSTASYWSRSAQLCGGSGDYYTVALAKWWTYLGPGNYGYSSEHALQSPDAVQP